MRSKGAVCAAPLRPLAPVTMAGLSSASYGPWISTQVYISACEASTGVLMLLTWRAGPERSQLKGIDHDCNDIPDAAMTLAVAALFAEGPTRIRNVYNWRVKVRFTQQAGHGNRL